MKVGLLAPRLSPNTGGGYTFVEMIVRAVGHFDLGVEMVNLDYEAIFDPPAPASRRRGANFLAELKRAGGTIRNPSDRAETPWERHTALLNEQISAQNVDLLWIPTPLASGFEPCVPYAMTVLDVAHRYFPFFPEVSTQGWTWQQREDFFSSMLSRAAYIFVGTQRGVQEVHECFRIPTERIRAIPLPTPFLPAAKADAAVPVKRPFLLYPAQFWAHKNHAGAIAALTILRSNYAMDLDLVLVGSDHGNERYVRQLVAEAGLTDHVHFLGFVERDRLAALYRAAQALLYVSFFGPDNLPPLEAFSCGCPAVVSDHPGHREQLADAAVFVDPLDPRAIADGVRMLLGDPGLRERLVAKGRAVAQSRDIHAYLRKVRDIFSEFSSYRRCWPPRSTSGANRE